MNRYCFLVIVVLTAIASACMSINARGGGVYPEYYPGPYYPSHYEVADGKSIRVILPVWFGIDRRVTLIVRGIDTPGISALLPECERIAGLKAKSYLQNLLTFGPMVVQDVEPIVNGYLASVAVRSGREVVDVASAVVARGHGVWFNGQDLNQPWSCNVSD